MRRGIVRVKKSYIINYRRDKNELIKELNYNNINEYVILNSQLASIYVPENFNEKILNKIITIAWWQRSAPMSSLIQITNNMNEGESSTMAGGTDYIYTNPYLTLSGKGIIIAVIDSGIDYLHPDFIDSNGETKIVAIWDQNSSKNSPPEDFFFGSEFTKDEINEAIKNRDRGLTEDSIGTGTLAAGIGSGYGNKDIRYKGVAVDSQLLVVKLREYKDTYQNDEINYHQSDFLAAIKYVIDTWKKYNREMIINLTVGQRSASIIEAVLLNSFEELRGSGIIVVSGAGNEGNTNIHHEGKVKNISDIQDIIFQVGKQTNLDIFIMTTGPDKIGAAVISPSGEISHNVKYSPEYYVYNGKFNVENTKYQMRFIYPWIETGNQELVINLMDVKPGIWAIRLIPEYIVTGEYDIYLPNKNLLSPDTSFIDPNSSATITLCATTEEVITVGCYNDKTNNIWISSSKGPVKNRSIKPDIVAPGVDIIGPIRKDSYNTATGTGISSSITCGIIALLIEYLKGQNIYNRGFLFTDILKTYLMLGATKKEIYKYPNISEGYGKINLKETISQISNNM